MCRTVRTIRTFNKANSECRRNWHLQTQMRAELPQFMNDPGIPGESTLKIVPGSTTVHYTDDPDGWVFFFELKPTGEPQYVDYQRVFERLIDDLYCPSPFNAVTYMQMFRLLQAFELVDDARDVWYTQPQNAGFEGMTFYES